MFYERGVFKMWYSGGWANCAVGYATSRDGIRWRKHPGNPVVGRGHGGAPGVACHSSIAKHAGRYYLYYADTVGDGRPVLRVATSPDGIRFRTHRQPALEPGGWAFGIANSNVWHDEKGWHMIFESRVESDRYWAMGRAESRDGLRWRITAGPLDALAITPTGMFGGAWLLPTRGGYQIYFHASRHSTLPTAIYTASSTDLTHWRKRGPVVDREQPWQYDQVADPSVVRVGCRELMFFSGMDNRAGHESGRIGLATRDRC